MEHANPLGEERIVKLLARFSIPAIVGMMVNALYNIVDRIFIGNSDYLGTNGLAAATVCFPIMIIVLAVGLLFGIGGATLFSIKLGEGKKEEAERVLGNAFVLLVLGGIVVSILGLAFMRKLLIYFGASDATLPHAEEYMSVIFWLCLPGSKYWPQPLHTCRWKPQNCNADHVLRSRSQHRS